MRQVGEVRVEQRLGGREGEAQVVGARAGVVHPARELEGHLVIFIDRCAVGAGEQVRAGTRADGLLDKACFGAGLHDVAHKGDGSEDLGEGVAHPARV